MSVRHSLSSLDLQQTDVLYELLSQLAEEVYRHRNDLADFEAMRAFDLEEDEEEGSQEAIAL